ncbi:unnamed protein product, partial [Didymodactylos carnosus]
AKTLLVYEQLLLEKWKEKIDLWKEHLNANLLYIDLDTKQIHINANTQLFSIFDEVKWFQRLEVDIPKAGLLCMQKEQTFKHYKSLLEDTLYRFKDLQSRIFEPFYNLFLKQIKDYHLAIEPGLRTLTWSSLNIDAYIANVHRALDRFEQTIDNVNKLIEERIDYVLDNDLLNCTLFNIDYIKSKIWLPGEFLSTMKIHIQNEATLIGKKLYDVQRTFSDVEDILKLTNKNTSRSRTPSTRRTTTTTTTTATPTTLTTQSTTVNPAIQEFIKYYKKKITLTIQRIIDNTLKLYIELATVNETKYLIDETKMIRYLFEGQETEDMEVDTNRIR